MVLSGDRRTTVAAGAVVSALVGLSAGFMMRPDYVKAQLGSRLAYAPPPHAQAAAASQTPTGVKVILALAARPPAAPRPRPRHVAIVDAPVLAPADPGVDPQDADPARLHAADPEDEASPGASPPPPDSAPADAEADRDDDPT